MILPNQCVTKLSLSELLFVNPYIITFVGSTLFLSCFVKKRINTIKGGKKTLRWIISM